MIRDGEVRKKSDSAAAYSVGRGREIFRLLPAGRAAIGVGACVAAWLCIGFGAGESSAADKRPNVLVIMTDDQGWGDFGFHGNPHLKTPHLDRLAGESVELTQFCVSPVCSPTRSSLLTGRYNYRTGVTATTSACSTMVTEEVTLAEMLSAAGYRTGIFGKWHLGDNYPSRPVDQGFAEVLVHRGGGIGQPSDPPGNHYFDPILLHNGRDEKTHGYCSDIFTDAAIQFITQQRGEPFFVYLPFNCPHTPLEVPPDYLARYQNLSLDDDTARIYGMIANIDDNVGRLLAKLDELGLRDDTIVVFLTDNGPQQRRFNGIWRDLKATVYEGGIRTVCLLRWPGKFGAGSKQTQLAAHIDLAPTLLAACHVARPAAVAFDGMDLLAWLVGERNDPLERTLFFQWQRTDVPQKFRGCAVRTSHYKLVQPNGRNGQKAFQPDWQLYDIASDPGEVHNIIDSHRQIADELKAAYERWFDDVSSTRGFPRARIIVGTSHENPVTLTRQDWRGPLANWGEKGLGNWRIEIAAAGNYDVTVRAPAADATRKVALRIADHQFAQPLEAGQDHVVFKTIQLESGTCDVEAQIGGPDRVIGAHYIDLLKTD
ncbi:MAG TPA: arylsulfatase [Pirellulales bacterium]|jgi:arylsulfatase A-like enzyme|nr:arylsulfatase [Pirellulales bacterium]